MTRAEKTKKGRGHAQYAAVKLLTVVAFPSDASLTPSFFCQREIFSWNERRHSLALPGRLTRRHTVPPAAFGSSTFASIIAKTVSSSK